jgi:hypothetical protein
MTVTEADTGETDLLLVEASDRDSAALYTNPDDVTDFRFTTGNGYVTYEITDGDPLEQFKLVDTRVPTSSLTVGSVHLFTTGVGLDREASASYTLYGARLFSMDSAVLGLGLSGCGCCIVRVFRENFALEDAIGSHACSLEALACV